MDNSITLYNLEKKPYYQLSFNKVIGKYGIFFIMNISEIISINLPIYDIITIQNYLYGFYNTEKLVEPLIVDLAPSNSYMRGYLILEPYCESSHLMYYEGISLYISIEKLDGQEPFGDDMNMLIHIDDVEKLYTLLQSLIVS